MATAPDTSGEAPGFEAGRWIAAAASGTLLIGASVLAAKGIDRVGVETCVRLTGRFAFAVFLPSYIGSALETLFGRRFAAFRRHARSLGLAFATVIVLHLGLVGWLCWIGGAPPIQTFVIFGIAAFWVAALAACSIQRISRAVGAIGWWVLRNVGMNYIAFAFALDFLRAQNFRTPVKAVEYLPFAAFSVLGPALRLAAWLSRIPGRRHASRALVSAGGAPEVGRAPAAAGQAPAASEP